ncbi:MAG TPA: low molecular weight protein-tyrosine-phosphatase [Acidimicrobiales bacterium]
MTWTSADHRTLPPLINELPYSVVFVCTGNICRSPIAEVITRTLAEAAELPDGSTLASRLNVSSAGTGPWHEGEPMDPRTADALVRAGYPRYPHVAHQFTRAKIDQFDLTVALDRRHQQTLRSLGSNPDRLFLLRNFDRAAGAAADVPDPYYGDEKVFDDCLSMIADGCHGIVGALVDLLSVR